MLDYEWVNLGHDDGTRMEWSCSRTGNIQSQKRKGSPPPEHGEASLFPCGFSRNDVRSELDGRWHKRRAVSSIGTNEWPEGGWGPTRDNQNPGEVRRHRNLLDNVDQNRCRRANPSMKTRPVQRKRIGLCRPGADKTGSKERSFRVIGIGKKVTLNGSSQQRIQPRKREHVHSPIICINPFGSSVSHLNSWVFSAQMHR